jgi:hypothetical protein
MLVYSDSEYVYYWPNKLITTFSDQKGFSPLHRHIKDDFIPKVS